jgi:hypothetical protein
MNNKQKIVLVVYALCIVLACIIFVPWECRALNYVFPVKGYSPLWEPFIVYSAISKPSIDIQTLGIEVFTITLVAVVAVLFFADKKSS